MRNKNTVLKKTNRFFLIFLFQIVSICSYAKSQVIIGSEKLVVTFKESTLKQIFKELEKKTDYVFNFGQDVAKDKRTYTFYYKDQTLQEIVSDLSTNIGFVYEVQNADINVRLIYKNKLTIGLLQDNIVTGKVTDMLGATLVGVNIFVSDSKTGMSTGYDGSYSIKVKEGESLIFSFLGMKTQTILVGGSNVINVKMVEDDALKLETVVIGYGKQNKSKITGAVSSIKNNDLKQYNVGSFEQALVGRLSGVQINQNSGQPGVDAQVVIRGVGTLTAGNKPLIVVDGFPLTEGSSLNSINTNDIATIDVLKDAASATIYGSRAGNGVILITTKKGKVGKFNVSFDTYSGIQTADHQMDFVNAQDAAQFFKEARDWGYVSRNPSTRSENDNNATRILNGANKRELRLGYLIPYYEGKATIKHTDWLDEIFRPALVNDYNLSISGASEQSNYYVSGSYFKQEGTTLGSDLERFTSLIKLNTSISKKIDFGISLSSSHTKQNFVDDSGDWNIDPTAAAAISYPFISAYNPDGSLAVSNQIQLNTLEDGALVESILLYTQNIKNQRSKFRIFGNMFANFNIANGLNFKTLLGGDYRSDSNDYYNPSSIGGYRIAAPKPTLSNEISVRNQNFISENTFTYDKTLDKHKINLLAGYTFQKEAETYTKVNASGITIDNLTNISAGTSFAVESKRAIWTQISYLSRFLYDYDNKYLLSLSIRKDGSSRFGDNSKWGTFPAVSLGWVISEESFFPANSMLSFTKLRTSWGVTGNNQIGQYGSKALVNPSDYVFGNTISPGFATVTSPNLDLSWETTKSYNFGIDFGFFQNKLNLNMNYYDSITSDLLLDVPVPEQSGFSSSIQNLGKVQNKGYEFELSGSDIKLGPITWDFGMNLSTNKNEVLALGPNQTEIRAGLNNAYLTKVGGPIAQLSGYNIIGVYKTNEEIASSPHLTGTLMGDYIVEDVNKDGTINGSDRKEFGTYAPKFTYGFNSKFCYKNFDLAFTFTGIEGRKKYEYDQSTVTEVGEGFGVPSQYYFDNRYHPVNNPDGFLGQPNLGNFSSARRNTRVANLFFQDADYLRLRNLQIGYNLPKSLLQKTNITQCRLYLSGNNLFTITKYRGYNTEASISNVLTSGYQKGNFPIAKTYLIGLNLNF
jgi:TonB-dependent starch-binding outer membrane protein SusC